jgi:teichuronic acid biosynthesis glycosyltransferase TuaC
MLMMLETHHPELASTSANSGACSAASNRQLKIVSLSCVFPRVGAQEFGIFVKRRLQQLAAHADVKVVSPAGVLDYSHPKGLLGNRPLPRATRDGALEILHPRWVYPPGGSILNAVLLERQMKSPLTKLRERFPFDVIDAHFGYPDGIAAAGLATHFGVPYTITLRGNEPMHCEDASVREAMAKALRGAGCVITVSESLRQFAISLGVDCEHVQTIPNGIDGGIFHIRDRSECRRKHGLSENEPVVLSAGSLIERKGHHRTIEAIAHVRRAGINARLVVAGGTGREGCFETEIRAAAAKQQLENAVVFTGHVDPATLAELMSAADVFCLASTREGWPNVVHEAMGCGTPAVATSVGAVRDMISEERGIVVPVGDQEALNEGLLSALKRVWNREAIATWAHARDWKRVGAEVAESMRRVVATSRGETE